jgi:hypothetical protein
MPNDAKLGLLAGVIGVIVVALVSANRPAPHPMQVGPNIQVTSSPPAHSAIDTDENASSVQTLQLPRTALAQPARTRGDASGTTTGRSTTDEINP